MLSAGTAMLDMSEMILIDEMCRKKRYDPESVDKEHLKAATCHVKQVVGPERSDKAAQLFLDSIDLRPSMVSLPQVEYIQDFVFALCDVSAEDVAGAPDDCGDE